MHTPAALQLAPAFENEHAAPQAPQSVSVRSEVSQPLLAIMSQLPYVELQLISVQEPPVQAGVPLAKLHIVPQPPQFDVVVSGVSQPLAALPSQLP